MQKIETAFLSLYTSNVLTFEQYYIYPFHICIDIFIVVSI